MIPCFSWGTETSNLIKAQTLPWGLFIGPILNQPTFVSLASDHWQDRVTKQSLRGTVKTCLHLPDLSPDWLSCSGEKLSHDDGLVWSSTLLAKPPHLFGMNTWELMSWGKTSRPALRKLCISDSVTHLHTCVAKEPSSLESWLWKNAFRSEGLQQPRNLEGTQCVVWCWAHHMTCALTKVFHPLSVPNRFAKHQLAQSTVVGPSQKEFNDFN